jgi:hypothetical protein
MEFSIQKYIHEIIYFLAIAVSMRATLHTRPKACDHYTSSNKKKKNASLRRRPE